MKSTVQIFSSGKMVAEFTDVEKVVLFSGNFVKIYYKENGKTRIVETNMPYIFYDGEQG